MLVGWAFLSPLSHYSGWAPGPVASTVDGARGWILWPALAIMCAESLMSIGVVLATTLKPYLLRNQRSALFVTEPGPHRRDSIDSNSTDGSSGIREPTAAELRADDEPSLQVVLLGVALSCVSCVVLVGIVFGSEGIAWWATIIALVLASIFSILGYALSSLLPASPSSPFSICSVRALGETDLNPVSAIGKISQLLFAIVQPNNVVANLVAGGISEAGAQQAGDLMQDLKTGYLWQASPKAQFQGQVSFRFRFTLCLSLTDQSYFSSWDRSHRCLSRPVYTACTDESTNFPQPLSQYRQQLSGTPSSLLLHEYPLIYRSLRLNLARLVNSGELPPRSKEAMIVLGLVFVGLSTLKMIARAREAAGNGWTWAKWLPSG